MTERSYNQILTIHHSLQRAMNYAEKAGVLVHFSGSPLGNFKIKQAFHFLKF